jgi:hypothetical protein
VPPGVDLAAFKTLRKMELIKKGPFACLYMSKVSKRTYDPTNEVDRRTALAAFRRIELDALIDEELARDAFCELQELQRREFEQYLVDSYTILFT